MSFKDDFQVGNVFPAASAPFGVDRFSLNLALVVAFLVLAAVTIWPVPASALSHEGGPFETISAAALIAAGLAALYRFPGLKRLYIGVVCLLLAERELEADVYAVDSLPFNVLNGLDLALEMTAVRVVLAIVVLGGLVWHGIPTGWKAFKARAPFLLVIVLAGTSAFVAQLLEEISDALRADISELMVTRLFVMEETLEMFFSIGILAAVLIGWPKTKPDETSHEQIAHTDMR